MSDPYLKTLNDGELAAKMNRLGCELHDLRRQYQKALEALQDCQWELCDRLNPRKLERRYNAAIQEIDKQKRNPVR